MSNFGSFLIFTRPMQQLTALCIGHQAVLSLDSGCEGNCITTRECERLCIPILPLSPNDPIPTQADGRSTLQTRGKAVTTFVRNKVPLHFEGYVIQNLAKPILCGLPFMVTNNIVQLPAEKMIQIGNKRILEDPPLSTTPNLPFSVQPVTELEVDVKDVLDTGQDNKQSNLSKIFFGKQIKPAVKKLIMQAHNSYERVFNEDLSEGYNGSSSNFDVYFNWVNNIPLPPHRGQVPVYCKQEELRVLQEKIEQLERQGIVQEPTNLQAGQASQVHSLPQ